MTRRVMKSWRLHPRLADCAPAEPPVEMRADLGAEPISVRLPREGRFSVVGVYGRFVVIDCAGREVSRPVVRAMDAAIIADRLNGEADRVARLGAAGQRQCLCCAHVFTSQGMHNRLCDPCRQRGHAPAGPF